MLDIPRPNAARAGTSQPPYLPTVLTLQFHIPIRLIQEVLPDVREVPSLQAMERVPARPVRLPDELHAALGEELVPLPHIARQAGADHVLPARLSAARDRHDVVERQLGRRELLPAVLATVAVAQV